MVTPKQLWVIFLSKPLKNTNIYITNELTADHLQIVSFIQVFREYLKALTEVEDCKPWCKEFD